MKNPSTPSPRAVVCRSRLGVFLCLFGGLALFPGFAGADPDRYSAVATVGMVADIVREVGGPNVEVETLIGEGMDPHLYKPSRNDLVALKRADIIFYNGLMLEGKMTDLLVRVARQGKPVYAVTESILDRGDYLVTDEEEYQDPHVWMDVGGWMEGVRVVRDALAAFDPQNVSDYRARAAAYLGKLEALDDYVREAVSSIPEGNRALVTAHDAFGYFGRAYGIEVRGIQGISTESEAGLRDIEALVDFLVENKIPAVFVETSVSDKNVRALLEGARSRGHDLSIGGTLFSDAMGPSGTYEGTYVGMLDHNATAIARALGGEVPAGGFREQWDDGD